MHSWQLAQRCQLRLRMVSEQQAQAKRNRRNAARHERPQRPQRDLPGDSVQLCLGHAVVNPIVFGPLTSSCSFLPASDRQLVRLPRSRRTRKFRYKQISQVSCSSCVTTVLTRSQLRPAGLRRQDARGPNHSAIIYPRFQVTGPSEWLFWSVGGTWSRRLRLQR
jgi:hypothetical protein